MEVETDGSRQDGGGRRLRHLAAGRVVYVALESRRACDLAHRERERETLRAKRTSRCGVRGMRRRVSAESGSGSGWLAGAGQNAKGRVGCDARSGTERTRLHSALFTRTLRETQPRLLTCLFRACT